MSWLLPLPLLAVLLLPAPAAAFDTAAKAAIMVDYASGDVLLEKSPDEPRPPASLSKLMTLDLVLARLKSGNLKLDDELPVSAKAWRTGGSKMFVKVGDRVKVSDLLRGVIVDSGNDACVVLAEALAGSEDAFAQRMNEQAKAIGLEHSTFVNSTGLPADPSDLMSVRDLATLARRLILDYPDFYPIFAEKSFTYNGITQQNRNPLLEAGVPGVDGMKTGFTDAAGYGLVSSAERDGRRIILVLAGLDSVQQRRSEGERMLEHGFRDFRQYTLYAAGQTVVAPKVWQGASSTVPLVADGAVTAVLSPDARKGLTVKLRYATPVQAPIAKGQRLGEVEIAAPGITTRIVPLVAADDVRKAGMIGRIGGAFAYLVWGGG